MKDYIKFWTQVPNMLKTTQSAQVAPPTDHAKQMLHFKSYISTLADPNCKVDLKLKVAQEISESFEMIISSSLYPEFLEHSIKILLNILEEGEPQFVAEYPIQQVLSFQESGYLFIHNFCW